MITDIPTLFIFVKDLQRSLAFYRDVIGLPVARAGEEDAHFEVGGFHFIIHQDLSPEEFHEWRVNPEPQERGWGVYLTFQTDDVDAEYARLKEKQLDFICEPRTMSWGTRMFLLRDPDGYILEISRSHENKTLESDVFG